MLCIFTQDLSNLLVEEDKAEEYIADVLSEVELLHKQVSCPAGSHVAAVAPSCSAEVSVFPYLRGITTYK